MMNSAEGRVLLVGESVISAASAIWWSALLWAHRNVLYILPDAVRVITAVLLSLPLTWFQRQRHQHLTDADLVLVAVRGVAVVTLSLVITGSL